MIDLGFEAMDKVDLWWEKHQAGWKAPRASVENGPNPTIHRGIKSRTVAEPRTNPELDLLRVIPGQVSISQ